MREILPFVIVGVATGSVYGLAGMGLVLTYNTSGIFNFAHGSVAAAGCYVFYELREQHGVPWPLAAAIVLLGFAPLAGVGLEQLARRLHGTTVATRIVATIGILFAVQGFAQARYGPTPLVVEPFLPTTTFELGGVFIGWDQVITAVIAAASAVALFLFFRGSQLGLAMRAVVEDPNLVALGGDSPPRIRRAAWAIGSAFATLSGLLLVPVIGLDALVLTLLVVYSFGAAAVGAFASLPLTYLGGLGIGVAANVSQRYVADVDWLGGLPPSLPFIVLFVALLVTPARRLGGADAKTGFGRPVAPLVPPPVRRVLLGVTVAGLAVVPWVVGARLPVYTNALIFVIVFLSLRLLVHLSGQVSLCHATFAAVGAATFSHLAHGAGVPWLLALGGAGIAAAAVGVLIALPAIRLSGLYLTLATFGFAILVEQLLYGQDILFGPNNPRIAPRPGGFESDTAFYLIVLGVVLAAMGVTAFVHRSRLGRILSVLSESPTALATAGVSPTVARTLVFAVSASLAGVAGALFGAMTEAVNGVPFGFFASLQWLTLLIVGGSARYGSAFIAAALIAVVPAYASGSTNQWAPVLYGVVVVLGAVAPGWTAGLRVAPEGPSRAGRRVPGRGPVAARLT